MLLIEVVLALAACSCHTTSRKQDNTDSGFRDAETRAQNHSNEASVSDSISDASSLDDSDLDTVWFDDASVGNLDSSLDSNLGSDSAIVNPIESGVDDSSLDADQTIQVDYLDTVEGNDYQQVSVGWGHACALRTDNTIICWGDNFQGRAEAPEGNYVQVSAGHDHVCALKKDGGVACWGGNRFGQATPPSDAYTRISSGHDYTCALTDQGDASCWGARFGTHTKLPGSFIDVSAGDAWVHVIKNDGRTVCQYETTGTNPEIYETCELYEHTYTQLNSSIYRVCGIRIEGEVDCWTPYNHTPDPVSLSEPIIQVGAAYHYIYELKSDGSIDCWHGLGSERCCEFPSNGSYRQISVAHDRVCAVETDGAVVCWKHSGTRDEFVSPPSGVFSQISVDDNNACAVNTDGRVSCWGRHAYYESRELENFPNDCIQVSVGGFFAFALSRNGVISKARITNGAFWVQDFLTPGPYLAVSVGPVAGSSIGDVCALTADARITCARITVPGQPPAYPDTIGSFTAVGAGVLFNCGLESDGTIACWNRDGNVDAPSGTFSRLSVGRDHACAIELDGSALCWGDNRYGQTEATHDLFTSISCGGDHTCALKTDDSVVCWGDNGYGQLNPPTGSFVQISSGGSSVCALTTDGRIECWGKPHEVNTDYIWPHR